MDAIATGLVRVGAYLLFRHQSALGVVAWLLVLLVVGTVTYLIVGWFHNRRPQEQGRHEKGEPGP
jgi:NADH:ubiquinone oxidoreductase subunit 5 (subunit L)/multisubunit Na+/H+ antiporter MnhA subunit